MKKIILILSVSFMFSSCATLLGGRVTSYQRTKPEQGNPSRALRIVPVIADLVIFPPYLLVDFLTKAIYKPDK